MSETTQPLTFDTNPHGYTTHLRTDGRSCPGGYCCGCATSLDQRFREQSITDRLELEERLWKATKAQLVAFLRQAGVQIFDADSAKHNLVTYAQVKQMDAWYPPRTRQFGEE